jgi:hypothetical protein
VDQHVPPSLPAPRPPSRLVIHPVRQHAQRGAVLPALVRRLATSWKLNEPPPALAGLELRVIDLHGNPIFQTRLGDMDLAINLSAGTYHVIARAGELERRYTLTLEGSKDFELFIALPVN